jgi:hypothetical protein
MKENIPKDGGHKLEVPYTRSPAMFIADDPGLDFLNSIGTPAGTVIEWLTNGEDLLSWLEQAKLIDSAAAAAIRANSFPGELDEVAAQARVLREGETVAQVFNREEPHPQAPHLQPDAHGFIWMRQEGFQNAFAQNAPGDVKAVAASVQRPTAVDCILEPAPSEKAEGMPNRTVPISEMGIAGPTLAYWLASYLLLLTVATTRKVRNFPQIAVSVTAFPPANFCINPRVAHGENSCLNQNSLKS